MAGTDTVAAHHGRAAGGPLPGGERHVGAPVLLPPVLGAVLLLFGSGFAAFATAQALTSGTIPLTAIQIGTFLNGNVLAGQQNVGMALGLVMIVIIAVVMTGYTLLQRRAARWLR